MCDGAIVHLGNRLLSFKLKFSIKSRPSDVRDYSGRLDIEVLTWSSELTYLEQAPKDGHAEIVGEGKQQKVVYIAVEHTERYSDPEEQVRAEFWAELIYRYQYEPNRIGIEIVVPDRTPSDRADLVVFRDDERKRPYAVVECKRDGITDAEFNQAVEQAYGNGTWAKFRADYVMVVAGSTRRVLDCTDQYGALERDKNIVADLPLKYGKPEEYKFRKGSKLDIQPVSKEALILAIRKCHQTLWGGLAGDKVTLSNTRQEFERIARSKNREPSCGSPKKYVPTILPKDLTCPSE